CRSDFALLPVKDVTSFGDGRVLGTSHWDRIMSRASKRVLLVAEQEIPVEEFEKQPNLTLVPRFMVEAYTVAPGSAWPGSCWPNYEVDYEAIQSYLDDDTGGLDRHMLMAPETKTGVSHA